MGFGTVILSKLSAVIGFGAVILSKLSAVTSVKWLALKLFGFIILLFRKKVVFAAAFFTTFSKTIRTGYEASTGIRNVSAIDVLWVLGAELQTKLLGSVSHVAEGLGHLLEFNLLAGIVDIWMGLSAIYMLYFIWVVLFRAKFQSDGEVPWPEKALLLVALVSLIAAIDGTQEIELMLERAYKIFDGIAQTIYEFTAGNETSVNSTLENAANSTG